MIKLALKKITFCLLLVTAQQGLSEESDSCTAKDSITAGWAITLNFTAELERLAFDTDVEINTQVTKYLLERTIDWKIKGDCEDVESFLDIYNPWISNL